MTAFFCLRSITPTSEYHASGYGLQVHSRLGISRPQGGKQSAGRGDAVINGLIDCTSWNGIIKAALPAPIDCYILGQ